MSGKSNYYCPLKVIDYLKLRLAPSLGCQPFCVTLFSSHDITAKAFESLLEFLRIGYNGKNRTHVLHQSQ